MRESDSCCSLSCKDSVLEKYVTVTKLRDITHWFEDMKNTDLNFRYDWIQQLTLCCQDSNSSHFLDVILYALASLSDHLSPQDCKSFWSLWAICFHSTNFKSHENRVSVSQNSTESLRVDLIGSTSRITDTCTSPWLGWYNALIAQDWVSCHLGDKVRISSSKPLK